MEMHEYLKKKAPEIDKEIEKIFPKKLDKKWLEKAFGKPLFTFDEKSCTKSIAEPIWDFLDRGGKRWRPALMQLSNEALGGNPQEIKPLLALPELIHNGTIAVDDIQDGAEIRRGKPCMHKKYGTDIAINAANAMYFIPAIALYKNMKQLEPKTKNKIYDLYAKSLLEVSFGQGMDIHWHRGEKENITENEYLQMCAYKTGTLARFSAKLGALLANGSEEQIEKLGKFATMIGVGFQIQDDILNLLPKSKEWGKEIGEDIKEGKRTLMVIHSMEKGSNQEKERLLEILNSHAEKKGEVQEAIKILEKHGSIEYAKQKAQELVKEAWEGVEPLLKESEAKEQLKAFADYLIERKY